MSKAARVVDSMPADGSTGEIPDSEVLDFRATFEDRSPLDELIREGARRMLQSAIEGEADDFIPGHAQRTDEHARRRVVRNGAPPEREILTGAGKLAVRQPRARDRSPYADDRVKFTPGVLPPYLKRTDYIEELITWLCLKEISTGGILRGTAGSGRRRGERAQRQRCRAAQRTVVSRT